MLTTFRPAGSCSWPRAVSAMSAKAKGMLTSQQRMQSGLLSLMVNSVSNSVAFENLLSNPTSAFLLRRHRRLDLHRRELFQQLAVRRVQQPHVAIEAGGDD